MLKLMRKKIFTILRSKMLFIETYTCDCCFNAQLSGISRCSVHLDEAGHIQYNLNETPKLPNEQENCTTYMQSRETLGELPESFIISAKGSDIGSLNVNSVSVHQYHHGTSEIHPGNLILQFPSKGIHLCN